MAEDAVFNIVIGVQNRERIQQLEKDIADAEKEILNLSKAINTAGQATTQQASQLRMYGKDIIAYKDEISQLTKENIKLGDSAADFSSRSVVGMVRGLKQLSEGSEGLVTTIPRLAMAFGGSGELALALGTTALAIDELGKHWEEVQDIFGKTEVFQNAGRQLAALGDMILQNIGMPSIEDISETYGRFAEQKREKEKDRKRAESLEAQAAGLQTEDEKKRSKAFREFLPDYGEERLKNELMQRATPQGGTPGKKEREFAEGQIAKGMQGKVAGFGAEFDAGFKKEQDREQSKEDFKLEQKALHEEQQEKKKSLEQMEHNQKEFDRRIEAEQKAQKREMMKVEEDSLQEQLVKLERQKRDQAEGFRENKLDQRFTFQRGGQAVAEAYQTDASTAIQKQQLTVQKAMQVGIDKVRDEIANLRKAGASAQ